MGDLKPICHHQAPIVLKNMIFKPKLVAPAGNLEKLKIALLYGADAVYFGGQSFNLRIASENLSLSEIKEGVVFAHNMKKRAYCLLNSFMHDDDVFHLKDFIIFLDELNIDGVIVSDLGVLQAVKDFSSLPAFLSTQASCVNSNSALFWANSGIKRVVLGREVSICNGAKIKKNAGLEVEMFVHGAMCMGYSGNCSISTYLQGRDSNRGGCGHACRFIYKTRNPETSFFMSSKDLCAIDCIPDFMKYNIDALKIEGRMKSNLYLATVVRAYAQALNEFCHKGKINGKWGDELRMISHREYCTGNLINKADSSTVLNEEKKDDNNRYEYVGDIVECIACNEAFLLVKNSFSSDDELEALSFNGENIKIKNNKIFDITGLKLSRIRPNSVVRVEGEQALKVHNVIRRKIRL